MEQEFLLHFVVGKRRKLQMVVFENKGEKNAEKRKKNHPCLSVA